MAPDADPPHLLRRILGSVVLVALLLALGMLGFRKLASQAEDSRKAPGTRRPALVRTTPVVRGLHVETVRVLGRAEALRRTTRRADVGGEVVWIDPRLEVGQALEVPPAAARGDAPTPPTTPRRDGPVVLHLDRSDLEDQRDRIDKDLLGIDEELKRVDTQAGTLKDRLAVAVRERDTAQRELDRIADLVAQGRLPGNQEDQQVLQVLARERAITDLEGALQDLLATKPILQKRRAAREVDRTLAVRAIERTEVRLPHAGIVLARPVEVGDRVAPGAVLFEVLHGGTVEIPLPLPARLHGSVGPGTRVRLRRVDAPQDLGEARVARVAPVVDDRQRTFRVFVELTGTATAPALSPGALVEAHVEARHTPDVLAIPREHFVGDAVYVAVPESPDAAPRDAGETLVRAERRVPVVARWLLDVALVTSGLETGEALITSNLEEVAHGAVLRVAPDAQASTPPR